jgi:hypothetical protein
MDVYHAAIRLASPAPYQFSLDQFVQHVARGGDVRGKASLN